MQRVECMGVVAMLRCGDYEGPYRIIVGLLGKHAMIGIPCYLKHRHSLVYTYINHQTPNHPISNFPRQLRNPSSNKGRPINKENEIHRAFLSIFSPSFQNNPALFRITFTLYIHIYSIPNLLLDYSHLRLS